MSLFPSDKPSHQSTEERREVFIREHRFPGLVIGFIRLYDSTPENPIDLDGISSYDVDEASIDVDASGRIIGISFSLFRPEEDLPDGEEEP